MAISFVGVGTADKDTTGLTSVPGLPAGIQTDDVLLAMGSNWFGSAIATMTGEWNRAVENSPSGGSTLQIHYTRRGDSDPASTTMTWDQAEVRIGAICAFRGVKKGGVPWNAIGANSTGSDGTIEHASVTTTVNNCFLLPCNSSDAETTRTLLSSYTNIFEDEDGGTQNALTHGASGDTTSLSAFYIDQGTAGATGTVTVNQSGSANWASALLALMPEPDPQDDMNFVWEAWGTNSVVLRTDLEDGDVVIIQIFRDGSNSEPGAISGWASYLVANAAGDSSSYKLYARVLGVGDGADLAGDTLSSANATTVHVGVWRPESGHTLAIGNVATSTAGSGTNFPFPAITSADTSHVITGGMHRAINGVYWTQPSGFLNRGYTLDSDATVFHESIGPIENWGGATVSVGGTSSQRRAWTIEIEVTSGDPTDDLTLSSIESASEVGTVTLEQIHALTANSVESVSSVGAPTLGQVHALTLDSIESISEVGSPTLVQVVALTLNSIEVVSEVGSPTLGQVHTLTPMSIQSLTQVGTCAITQVHALGISDVEVTSEVGSPTVSVAHVLTLDSVETTAEVGAPSITQIHALGIGNIQVLTEVGSPTLGQVHVLVANDIEVETSVGAPILQAIGEEPEPIDGAQHFIAPVIPNQFKTIYRS